MELRRPHPIWGYPDDIAMMGALKTCSIHQYTYSHRKKDSLRSCPWTWYDDEKEVDYTLVPSPRQNQIGNKGEPCKHFRRLRNIYSVDRHLHSYRSTSLPSKQPSSTPNMDMGKTDKPPIPKKKAEVEPKYKKFRKNPIAPWNRKHDEFRALLDFPQHRFERFKPKLPSQSHKNASPEMVFPLVHARGNVRSLPRTGDVLKTSSKANSKNLMANLIEVQEGYATYSSHENEDADVYLLSRADTSSSTRTGSPEMAFHGSMMENVEEESEKGHLWVFSSLRDTPDSDHRDSAHSNFLLGVAGNKDDDNDVVLNNLWEYADSDRSEGMPHPEKDYDSVNASDDASVTG